MGTNEALRRARMKRYWTQSTLAAQLNTTRITVVRWEQGKTVPSLYFREQLCKLFNMTEQELGLSQPSQEEEKVPLWLVPEVHNPYFTGRIALLQYLYQQFLADAEQISCHVHIISGLPGVGKTQFALEYAHRYRSHFTTILWVRAETQELLIADMRRLAIALQLPDLHEQNLHVLMASLRLWLETHNDWLLIVDNVEEFAQINRLLPVVTASGCVLITTRSSVVNRFSNHLHLPEMEREEAALFLLRRAKLLPLHVDLSSARPDMRALAIDICQELGDLPLAIDQAGAYIEETGCGLSGYRQRFQHHYATLLSWRGQHNSVYSHTVMSIMCQTQEEIERQSPIAMELLKLCIFLSPQGIPEELITSSAPYLGPFIQQAAADLLSLDEAFIILKNSGLLWRDQMTHLLRMHRLTQIIIREHLKTEVQIIWVNRALHALNHLFSAHQQRGRVTELPNKLLLPHILTCLDHLERLPWGEQQHHIIDVSASLLPNVAHYLLDEVHYDTYAYAVDSFSFQIDDAAYLKVATSLQTLALLYQKKGDYNRAKAFTAQASLLLRHNVPE